MYLSVTNSSEDSHLGCFDAKAESERALTESGISCVAFITLEKTEGLVTDLFYVDALPIKGVKFAE